jgi:hypothetical protein
LNLVAADVLVGPTSQHRENVFRVVRRSYCQQSPCRELAHFSQEIKEYAQLTIRHLKNDHIRLSPSNVIGQLLMAGAKYISTDAITC